MRLEFPQVDEIPLLVKLVSAGEQDIFAMESPGLDAIRFRGIVFPPITLYKPERFLVPYPYPFTTCHLV